IKTAPTTAETSSKRSTTAIGEPPRKRCSAGSRSGRGTVRFPPQRLSGAPEGGGSKRVSVMAASPTNALCAGWNYPSRDNHANQKSAAPPRKTLIGWSSNPPAPPRKPLDGSRRSILAGTAGCLLGERLLYLSYGRPRIAFPGHGRVLRPLPRTLRA